MMELTFRPLQGLDGFTGSDYETSQFNVTWSTALDLLEREVRMLRGSNVVIEIDVDERDIRLDGRLRADARPRSNRARVSFDSEDHGHQTFETDRFLRGAATYSVYDREERKQVSKKRMAQDWQHNVYAIARGLEALRTVTRYGIADRGQQYAGYKAIGTAMGMSADAAWEIIAITAGVTTAEAKKFTEVTWKQARKVSHPDVNDGDHEPWNRLMAAGRVVGLS